MKTLYDYEIRAKYLIEKGYFTNHSNHEKLAKEMFDKQNKKSIDLPLAYNTIEEKQDDPTRKHQNFKT